MFLFRTRRSRTSVPVYLNDFGSADIADLFAQDEKDRSSPLMKKAKVAGFRRAGPRLRLLPRCGICTSPLLRPWGTSAGAAFPALVNCTVIDWFSLAQAGLYRRLQVPGAMRTWGATRCAADQASCPTPSTARQGRAVRHGRRYAYTTPKSYLELLKLYRPLGASARRTTRRRSASERRPEARGRRRSSTSSRKIAGWSLTPRKKATADDRQTRQGREGGRRDGEREREHRGEEGHQDRRGGDGEEGAEADLARPCPRSRRRWALDTLDVKQLRMRKTRAPPASTTPRRASCSSRASTPGHSRRAARSRTGPELGRAKKALLGT